MSGLEIAFGIVLMVFAVGIIAIVLLQEGQQKNNSVITGGSSDTFLSKHQGRSIDAFSGEMDKIYCHWFLYFCNRGEYYFVLLPQSRQCWQR